MSAPFSHSEIDLALDAEEFGLGYTAPRPVIPAEQIARVTGDYAAAGLEAPADLTPEEWRFEAGLMIGMAVFAVLFLFWMWGQG